MPSFLCGGAGLSGSGTLQPKRRISRPTWTRTYSPRGPGRGADMLSPLMAVSVASIACSIVLSYALDFGPLFLIPLIPSVSPPFPKPHRGCALPFSGSSRTNRQRYAGYFLHNIGHRPPQVDACACSSAALGRAGGAAHATAGCARAASMALQPGLGPSRWWLRCRAWPSC